MGDEKGLQPTEEDETDEEKVPAPPATDKLPTESSASASIPPTLERGGLPAQPGAVSVRGTSESAPLAASITDQTLPSPAEMPSAEAISAQLVPEQEVVKAEVVDTATDEPEITLKQICRHRKVRCFGYIVVAVILAICIGVGLGVGLEERHSRNDDRHGRLLLRGKRGLGGFLQEACLPEIAVVVPNKTARQ